MKERKNGDLGSGVKSYSSTFKLEVLSSYYSSGKSINVLLFDYGISRTTLYHWVHDFENGSKSLSLSAEQIERLTAMRKKREESAAAASCSAEALREENARLRKALEYSELRNEALQELLIIGREEYGLDLLKKAGAKQ